MSFVMFRCLVMPFVPRKRVKVRRPEGDVHGVAVRDFDELKSKGLLFLKIRESELSSITLKSGSSVTEKNFSSIKQDDVLIFRTVSDTSGDVIRSAVQALERATHYPDAVEQMRNNDNLRKLIFDRLLPLYAHVPTATEACAERREDDPQWFTGIEHTYRTKSAVMESRAMNRVRTFYYEAKTYLEGADLTKEQKNYSKMVLQKWWQRLKSNDMFKYYFSRANVKDYTFCDRAGTAKCEGEYNASNCERGHQINPYSSYDERVMFSTWNLDHCIEKSRTVLPKMVELIQLKEKDSVNWDYLFELMYTRKNIKLVHIVCHNKQTHTDATINEHHLYK